MKLDVNTRSIALASALTLPMLLSACASAPSVCPNLPELPAVVELGPSFQTRMRGFLSGKLPEQTNSVQPSKPARPGSTMSSQ